MNVCNVPECMNMAIRNVLFISLRRRWICRSGNDLWRKTNMISLLISHQDFYGKLCVIL